MGPYACDRCGRFVLLCAWPRCPDVCLECVAHCRSLQLVPFLRKILYIEPSLDIVTLVDQFSFDYSAYTRKSRQLHFLESVLRSRGSPFLQFTYFHNGALGKHLRNRRHLGQNYELPMSTTRRMSWGRWCLTAAKNVWKMNLMDSSAREHDFQRRWCRRFFSLLSRVEKA